MFDDMNDKDMKDLDLDFEFDDKDFEFEEDEFFKFDDEDEKQSIFTKTAGEITRSNWVFIGAAIFIIALFIIGLGLFLISVTYTTNSKTEKILAPSYNDKVHLVFPDGTKDWRVIGNTVYCLIKDEWYECYPVGKESSTIYGQK